MCCVRNGMDRDSAGRVWLLPTSVLRSCKMRLLIRVQLQAGVGAVWVRWHARMLLL